MPKNPHPPRGGSNQKKPTTVTANTTEATTTAGSSKKGKAPVKSNESTKPSGPIPKAQGSKSSPAENITENSAQEPPKKPDTRTLIGGASWTGKLPVNLLSEHCQKQKWNKPEYNMTRISQGFISNVILSAKNPKTGEVTILPTIEISYSHRPDVAEPTAVEARHFAAAYALFRISSMKNTHMMLPPKYKDLWKGLFTDLKKEDVGHGKAWLYEADPFAAIKAKEDAEKAKAKKQEEEEKLKAKQAENPSLSLSAPKSRAWERAPGVDMGKKVRFDVESLIRKTVVWNMHGVKLTAENTSSIVKELSKLDFRRAHIEEACEICKDKEEVLEWLLTHIPEDDLPKWSLPENYTAGVSMASSDLKRDASIKRLASAGYSVDLCEEMLAKYEWNERKAASVLQAQLFQIPEDQSIELQLQSPSLEDQDQWAEEQDVLSSIYGERYLRESAYASRITLDKEVVSPPIVILFQKPVMNYPNELPILMVQAKLPAYIRLSITKQTLLTASSSFRGEQMIFNIIDWLEQNISDILSDPGRLSSVSSASIAGESREVSKQQNRRKNKPKQLNMTPNSLQSQRIREEWKIKQSSPALQQMLISRHSLPAWKVRHQVIDAVNRNRVTIISGETGSGKSTQSVQFILDDLIEKGLGAATNIICTQPRRISALGLADRVAEERGGKVGNEVGYIIRGDSKTQPGTTKITFVTTGVLLRRLQTSGGSENDVIAALADVSHVVIDEVHERAVDADFLLVLLKGVLKKRRDLKVILMSATADADAFEQYFSEIGTVGRVHIYGRTFPVTDYYKDDIIRLTGYKSQETEDNDIPQMDEKLVSAALRASGMRVDYELLARTVEVIDKNLGDTDGGILIFLPGMMEIERALQTIRHKSKFHALPLHASLPPSDQRRVFPPAPKGTRKVIAATNVAETSITIPDIVAVIDTGRVKETTFDPVTRTQKLIETWASRASCAQRRGRAGRVREGVCYKLFTRNMEANMRERPDPEILRVPLEQLCLSVKSMGVDDVVFFLESALTPPSSHAVKSALQLLLRIGALESAGGLTALGKHLAMIPADLKSAKLLVMGCTFGCADACLSIAAILASRSLFVNPPDKRDEVKKTRYDFAPGQGDLISDLRAYEAWTEKRKTLSSRDLRQWCLEHFLGSQTLRDVESNRAQLISALQDIGFLSLSYRRSTDSQSLNTNNSNDALLRALIAASLYPQVFRIDFPATKFVASHTGSVALDPEARTIKFFDEDNNRAFVHPSSVCFEAGRGWSSDVRFLAAWERFESGEGYARKPWARGVSPCNVYSVLLFGGPLELDTTGRGVVVDGWVKVRGWARIGVLVSRLRGLLDRVLEKRVDDPMSELSADEQRVLDIVRRLVERDGLDR
jgi:ATP-dependent RNA helicase DHX57